MNTVAWTRLSFVLSYITLGILSPLLLKARPAPSSNDQASGNNWRTSKHGKPSTDTANPSAAKPKPASIRRAKLQTQYSRNTMRRRVRGEEISLRWGNFWSDVFSTELAGIHAEKKKWVTAPTEKPDPGQDGYFSRLILFFSTPKVTIFNAAVMNIVFVMILYGYSITGQTYKFKKFDYFIALCMIIYLLANFR